MKPSLFLLFAPVGGGTVWALVVFARRCLDNVGFWFDEAMQFFMSLGSDPFAGPFTRPGRLIDAVHLNGRDNLDPGGLTILLHWWLHGGTDAVWLRTLPLFFFLLGAAALALIGWRRFRSLPFALLCGLVPALYPLLLFYATELRAYSMEFAGITVGCALIDTIALKRTRDPLLLAAGATFAFFLTSRYAFALFTAACAFALVTSCYLRRRAGAPTTRLADLPALAVPVATAALLIALFALWPQYKARISYEGGAMLQYFAATTAAAKSFNEILYALAHNLFGRTGLPITIAALAGLLVLLQKTSRKDGAMRARIDGVAERVERADLAPICLICLGALALSVLTWRWHPWDTSAKWSLWLHGLSAVVLVQFAAAALACMPARFTASAFTGAALLVAAALLDVRLATYQRGNWPDLVSELTKLESLEPAAGTVAIDVYDYPRLRYLYENGPLTGHGIYPGAFRFNYANYNEATRSLIAPDTRLMVSGRDLADATKFFAPTRILADPEFPPHLFRVEPAAQ
jgi:hypothetical protein